MKLARDNPGKEILLNSAGNRDNVKNDVSNLDYVESISVPDHYRQDKSVVYNSCVWLAACLMIRSVDINVAEIMTQKYGDDPTKFEWLYFFKKSNAPYQNSLYDMVKNLDECPYYVRRVQLPPTQCRFSIAKYFIQKKEIVLLVVQLTDPVGNICHAVGINIAKRIIHDCQENNALSLSFDNLSYCCGLNRTFSHFHHYCEICPNDPPKMQG